MISKTRSLLLFFLVGFSFCAADQVIPPKCDFASTDFLEKLRQASRDKKNASSNNRLQNISPELSPEEIEQKKSQITELLEQSINDLYHVKTGYACFAFAIGMAALSLAGIYNYVPSRRVYIGEGFDRARGVTVRYYDEITDMPEAERRSLIQSNKFFWFFLGGFFGLLFALTGYFMMNYANDALLVAKEYQNNTVISLTVDQYNAVNDWFNKLANNLKINGLDRYLYLVDSDLARAFSGALNKISDNFINKCECALHACLYLGFIEKKKA